MTFSKENLSRKIKDWEINRFCSKIDTQIVGAASRLFKRFISDINPSKVISYSDNRWGTGTVYERLGMVKVSDGTPNYWWIMMPLLERKHRYSLRKQADEVGNLYEIRKSQGYDRVWDCGSAKYVWKSLDNNV